MDEAYGISRSRYTPTASLRVRLTAHEIGHNFGATHPDRQSPAPPSCGPSLMNSVARQTTSFCPFSRDEIISHVAGTADGCLSRLAAPGCAYSVSKSSQFFTAAGGAAGLCRAGQ